MRFVEKQWLSVRKRIRDCYNFFTGRAEQHNRCPITGMKELNEVLERARQNTLIADHLVTLFTESLVMRPRLILELGVHHGESTFVFERVARLCGSTLVSVDIADCRHASSYEDWIFIQQDDIQFASEFPDWCARRMLVPKIDVLFIDTSHLFEHTLREIESYFPYLSPRAKVFLHDSNLNSFFFRRDGRMELGWNNKRGVIRALESYFSKPFNEKEPFVDFEKDFLIRHYPYCSGLSILERIGNLMVWSADPGPQEKS